MQSKQDAYSRKALIAVIYKRTYLALQKFILYSNKIVQL